MRPRCRWKNCTEYADEMGLCTEHFRRVLDALDDDAVDGDGRARRGHVVTAPVGGDAREAGDSISRYLGDGPNAFGEYVVEEQDLEHWREALARFDVTPRGGCTPYCEGPCSDACAERDGSAS